MLLGAVESRGPCEAGSREVIVEEFLVARNTTAPNDKESSKVIYALTLEEVYLLLGC
jgi:hypothetical protein